VALAAPRAGITAAHPSSLGTAATELTFGGRRVQVRRPRVRQTAGGEATLPSVAVFRDRDPLSARMMQQLLAGVSTRQYEASWRRDRRAAHRATRVPSVEPWCGGPARLREHSRGGLDGLEVVRCSWTASGGPADGDRRPGDHGANGGKVPLGCGWLDGERRGLYELLQDCLRAGSRSRADAGG